MDSFTIAIDAMGGDFGVAVTVPAALKALDRHKSLNLVLVGDSAQINKQINYIPDEVKQRIVVHHTTQQVEMDESPAKALRTKKDSSMRVAIDLVKSGVAQACVSAGNTGALMATARFVLKTLSGVDRPAIIAALPTYDANKVVRVLDLGANVDSCADHLYQFAVMGTVLVSSISDIEKPTVGLLNIGAEEIKGNDLVKCASRLLAESKHINYYGYIEADDIFKGVVDIVVCDGFVGNVALKTMEGLAKMVGNYAKKAFVSSWYGKIAALISSPILRRLKKDLDPGRRNGASLLGLQGIVVKSHGGADVNSYANAIEEAILEVKKNVPARIGEEVGIMLEETGF